MIADHGYLSHDYFKDFGGGRYMPQETVKFFPAYPTLIRLFTFLVGNAMLAGVIVSNLAALIFLYYLYKLGEHLLNAGSGFRASLLYIAYPTAFFLSAIYSEALFFAALTAAFYYLEKKKILFACLAAAVAML